MIKVKDGYAKLIGTTYLGSASRVLLSNGGDHVLGNASGNIPLSNGTVNTNLNADLLDGLHIHTGRNNEANKIVRTDANGFIQAGWINTTSGNFTGTPNKIYASNDDYIRYMTPANFFPLLTNTDKQLDITIGGLNRKLTVSYATEANLLNGALVHMCSLYTSATYKAYKITTNWHKSWNAMPTINIRGYAYGSIRTIDCDIVIYHYNNNANNYSFTNKGSYPIKIWQAIENDILVFYIDPGEYYGMFNVFVYGGINTDKFTGWTMSAVESVSGTEISQKAIASSITGNAATATNAQSATKSSCVGDGHLILYPQYNNEINFGGTNDSAKIYFGYRAADSRPIPTSFIFGGGDGIATLTGSGFIKKGSNNNYLLLGGGGHKLISDFASASSLGNYLPLTGGTVYGGGNTPLDIKCTTTNAWCGIGFLKSDGTAHGYIGALNDNPIYCNAARNATYTIWHGGNDGSGSGLDADMLDGLHSSGFLRRYTWWYSNDTTKNADDLTGGTTFAYAAVHNSITTGTIVSFDSNLTGYTLQLLGTYAGKELYFRNRNGDKSTWNDWSKVIHSNNYTSYLGYIGTTAVQASSAIQNLTGIGSINMAGDILIATNGDTGIRLLRIVGGSNDYGRIAVGASANNAGWMEIATCDDAVEPIYVRLYTGVFSTVKKQATLLDANGNTSFPGIVNTTHIKLNIHNIRSTTFNWALETGKWYRIMESDSNIVADATGDLIIYMHNSGNPTTLKLLFGLSYNNLPFLLQLWCTGWSTIQVSKARIVYKNPYGNLKAYLEILANWTGTHETILFFTGTGWTPITPVVTTEAFTESLTHKLEISLSHQYSVYSHNIKAPKFDGTATKADSVTVTSSDNNNSYRMVWHSGNSLYSTAGIYCNPSTDSMYASFMELSRTTDHGLKVGSIRGTAVGSRTGLYIHMYERVHIGSPNGWGSSDAPTQGLSTYGGAWLATNKGNVGIGTTSPSYKLHVVGTSCISSTLTMGGIINTCLSKGFWITGKTEAAIKFNSLTAIDSSSFWRFYNMKSVSGNVVCYGGLGDNIGFYGYYSGTTANLTDWKFTVATGTGHWTASGSIYAAHFYENSDEQLKTNIQEILNSDKMPIIKEFDWKEDNSHSYGLIAQELEELGYSELVSVKDDGYKTVNYSAALSLIVGKLQVKIKELEKEIENLKNKN